MTEKNKALLPGTQSVMGSGERGVARRGCRGPSGIDGAGGAGARPRKSLQRRCWIWAVRGVCHAGLCGPNMFHLQPQTWDWGLRRAQGVFAECMNMRQFHSSDPKRQLKEALAKPRVGLVDIGGKQARVGDSWQLGLRLGRAWMIRACGSLEGMGALAPGGGEDHS